MEIRQVTWSEASHPLSEIRREVFIVEQAVPPELELDGQDDGAFHLIALTKEGTAIGCVRMLRDGHIGRMAVLKPWRGQGVGGQLLEQMIKLAKEMSLHGVELDAQCHALPFYQRFGFVVCSETFMDAGIPHKTMKLPLTVN